MDAGRNRLARETSPYLLQHAAQPGRLVAWGPGARGSQARATADPALGRLRRLPLVPRDGARELRGRGDRARDERAVRQHQGRSRGAAGHRSDLHGGAACAGRAGRLAADHVPHARRRADVRRHLLAARAALGPPLVPAGSRMRRRNAWRNRRKRWRRRGLDRRPSGEAVGQPPGRACRPADLDAAVGDALLSAVDPVMAASAARRNFPNAPIFRFFWNEMFRRGDPRFGEAVRAMLEA